MPETDREGVCCECLSVHPVRSAPKNPLEDLALEFFPSLAEAYEEEGNWVMDTHDAFGSHCDGSGTMPQAVLAARDLEDAKRNAEYDRIMEEPIDRVPHGPNKI